MKKIITYILILTLVVSCFSGCANQETTEDAANQEKENGNLQESGDEITIAPQEDLGEKYGLTDELSQKLSSSVILKKDMNQAFVKGFTKKTTYAPFDFEGETYIPGAFVTLGLGGNAESDSEFKHWTISLEEKSWTIDVLNNTAKKDETEITINKPIISVEDDFMISTVDYEKLLDIDSIAKNGTIFIGEDLDLAIETIPVDGEKLLQNMIDAHLTADNAEDAEGDVIVEQNNVARLDISKIIDLDPAEIPFAVTKDTLVANSGHLYIDNVAVERHPSQSDYAILKMTVYNTGMTYAIAESYSNDEVKIADQIIEPYGGRFESVGTALVNCALIIKGAAKWLFKGDMSEVEYRSSAVAGITEVSLEVPIDGYVFITNNPEHSDSLAAYAALLFSAQLYISATSVASLSDTSASLMRSLMVDSAMSTIENNAVAISQLAGSFREFLNKEITASPLNVKEYLSEFKTNFTATIENCGYDIVALLEKSVEIAKNGLFETIDTSINEIMSLCPPVEMALYAMNIIAESEKLICMINEYSTASLRTPIVFKFTDWRTAYAKLLRTQNFYGAYGNTPRFGLCYIDGNSIPELIIMDSQHYKSRAHVFTFKNGRVQAVEEETWPTPYGYLTYYEFGDVSVTSYLNRGYESISYGNIMGNDGRTFNFYNDYYAMQCVESATTYKFNGVVVSKSVYDYNLALAKSIYGCFENKQLGYEMCYEITEANITKIIENK